MNTTSLLQDFIIETQEHLDEIEMNLLKIKDGESSKEIVGDIFRSIHTIKGSSDYLGLRRIAKLSHRLETLLDLIRRGEMPFDHKVADLLISANDRIGALVEDLSESEQEQHPIGDLIGEIDLLTNLADKVESNGNGMETDPSKTAEIDQSKEPLKSFDPSTPGDDSNYEEDQDEELFQIFVGQLNEGLATIVTEVGNLVSGVDTRTAVENCLKHVKVLHSSANYMGYEKLCDLYDLWLEELTAFRQRLPAVDAEAISALIETTMGRALDEIKALFPTSLSVQIDINSARELRKDPAPDEDSDGGLDDSASMDLLDGSLEEPSLDEKASDDPADEDNLLIINEEELFGNESEDSSDENPPVDDSLLCDFIEEAGEHLQEMENHLVRLADNPASHELISDIFRSVHTIKGSSEYIGLHRIAALSHSFESLLDKVRRHQVAVDDQMVDVLINAKDRMEQLVDDLGDDRKEKARIDDLIQAIEAFTASHADRDETSAETSNEKPHVMAEDEPEVDSDDHPPEKMIKPYEEEYDEELFAIFLEQLDQGLKSIEGELTSLAKEGDPERFLANCSEHIDILQSSANYMGYEALHDLYRQWRDEIMEFNTTATSSSSSNDMASLQESARDYMQQIATLFPALPLHVEPETSQEEIAPEPAQGPGERAPDLLENYVSDSGTKPEEKDDGAAFVGEVSTECDPIPAVDEELLVPPDQKLFAKLEAAINGHETGAAIGSDQIDLDFIEDELFSQDESKPHFQRVADPELPEIEEQLFSQTRGDDHAPSETDTQRGHGEDKAGAVGNEEVQENQPPAKAPATAVETSGSEAGLPGVAPASDHPAEKPRQVDTDDGPPAASRLSGKKMLKHSIRVDASKIDALMNQVGELVVNRAFFSQLNNEMRQLQQYLQHTLKLKKKEMKHFKSLSFKLGEATVSLGRVANDMQEGVMRVRMLPIARLFNRYPRLVHDLTRETEKKIRLDITGEDTELDKMVIEEITDPLIHIIRNAVDHGIESTRDRIRAGKPRTGTIHLEAYHESNHVVIEIMDDGRGLDLERIRTKVLEKSLASAEELAQMTEKELTSLIMLPGFSTTDKITQTSGRGVGMDVVKKNIEKLNGTIEIESKPGLETRFRIKIPLTLAIFPALLVRVGNDLFTIPLSNVEETIRVFVDEISTIESVEVLHLRDEPLPLLRLSNIFNVDSRTTEDDKMFVVVVNTGVKRVGLVVDTLIGQEEVVIKPLEDYLQENSGFSGATILGDGRISLILDVYELVNLYIDKKMKMKAEEVPD